MSRLRIELGERSYNLEVYGGIIACAGELVSEACPGRRAAVVTNRKIGELYGERVVKSLDDAGISAQVIVVPAGEKYKTLRTVAGIYEKLLDQRLDRSGVIIGLGGGIVGDMAGFAAATFLRGVDFVQIPTSLLAQVDASIGGKTGVNLSRGKNLVGAFHQPRVVIIDTDVLSTLPRREFRAGLAEIIKHAIIRDVDYFTFLERNLPSILRLDHTALERTIERSCEIKAEVVRADERELGLRRILNYGHTAAHAIERLTAYRTYKHGEAVAMGMVTASMVAREMGSADPDLVERIVGLVRAAGLPYTLPMGLDAKELVSAMGFDKKVSHGRLNTVVVSSIGHASVTDDVSPEVWLGALARQKMLS
jgi:3-dehydroquinate synthase